VRELEPRLDAHRAASDAVALELVEQRLRRRPGWHADHQQARARHALQDLGPKPARRRRELRRLVERAEGDEAVALARWRGQRLARLLRSGGRAIAPL